MRTVTVKQIEKQHVVTMNKNVANVTCNETDQQRSQYTLNNLMFTPLLLKRFKLFTIFFNSMICYVAEISMLSLRSYTLKNNLSLNDCVAKF